MTLELYSLIIATSTLALLGAVVLSMILSIVLPRFRAFLRTLSRRCYFSLLAIFTLISVVGAAMYQYAYGLLVCEYCWWQRVFIIPIFFVALISAIKNIRENTTIITVLSLCGLFFGGYHLYVQYQQLFFQTSIFTPCSVGGPLPSCADTAGIEVFGFVTIPFMAVVFLITALWINYLASRSSR